MTRVQVKIIEGFEPIAGGGSVMVKKFVFPYPKKYLTEEELDELSDLLKKERKRLEPTQR